MYCSEVFKYRGKKYQIGEVERFPYKAGVIYTNLIDGISLIMIKKGIPEHKKRAIVHRLLKFKKLKPLNR